VNENVTSGLLNDISFRILQACNARITKTEYIACPSCGRTLYDIQGSLQKIKEKTSHLAGLKIGVMGCIVNGPGEMADADYGYVGMGSGKVAIFKGRQLVKKEVDEAVAIDELIKLIKQHGDWRDKTD
jgi:(E)-4-hydroxy-3-methylbut-2-enyl-diphosphate synthase